MHSVNPDLLRTGPHHPDGRPKDPHAHHAASHRAALRSERRARWLRRLDRLRRLAGVRTIAPGPAPADAIP